MVSCVCGQRFNAPSHLAGQQLPCPVCRQPILISLGNSGLDPWNTPALPPAGNDLWSELPAHQSLPSFHPQTPQQASWSAPQQQASPHTALANQYMANAYHQDVEKRQDLDDWGTGKIYSGIITMAIAAIWFCSGLAFGIIFFFPPCHVHWGSHRADQWHLSKGQSRLMHHFVGRKQAGIVLLEKLPHAATKSWQHVFHRKVLIRSQCHFGLVVPINPCGVVLGV